MNIDTPETTDWIKRHPPHFRFVDDPTDKIRKGLPPGFGARGRRRAQLVRSLKRRRRYANPVRGGTGKQKRTRRNKFN